MRRNVVGSIAVLVPLFVAAACGSNSKPPASQGTRTPASAAPSQPATAMKTPSATASPAPSPAALPPDVAAVIDLLNTATTGSQLLDHAQLTPTECREELTQLSNFTKCPPGSHNGDFVPLFRMAGCEPGTESDVINKALDDWTAHPRSLYAVIREDPSSVDLYNWVPPGDYGIVYRFGEGFGMLFTVADGRILGAAPGCGSTPEGIIQTVPPGQVLLGPLPAK